MPRKRRTASDNAQRPGTKRKRYTESEKRRILKTAERESLTGEQVAKRFGIAQLTFYRWRGPVRKRSGTRAVARDGISGLRSGVRSSLQAALPGIIREEVNAYLDRLLPRRGPGRPRRS